jgi:hypothetical protein
VAYLLPGTGAIVLKVLRYWALTKANVALSADEQTELTDLAADIAAYEAQKNQTLLFGVPTDFIPEGYSITFDSIVTSVVGISQTRFDALLTIPQVLPFLVAPDQTVINTNRWTVAVAEVIDVSNGLVLHDISVDYVNRVINLPSSSLQRTLAVYVRGMHDNSISAANAPSGNVIHMGVISSGISSITIDDNSLDISNFTIDTETNTITSPTNFHVPSEIIITLNETFYDLNEGDLTATRFDYDDPTQLQNKYIKLSNSFGVKP